MQAGMIGLGRMRGNMARRLGRHGIELTAGVLEGKASLQAVAAQVADSGEGRWTAQEAIDLGIPIPVISAALLARFSSQGGDDFGARVLAMLRNSFGGHVLPGK